MNTTPSTNGDNGRDAGGRFAPGNPGGPGNPHAAKAGKWRAVLTDAVSEDDIREVIGVLLDKAKTGVAWAVRELLDRTLGKRRPDVAEDDKIKAIEVTYVDAAGLDAEQA